LDLSKWWIYTWTMPYCIVWRKWSCRYNSKLGHKWRLFYLECIIFFTELKLL